MEVSAEAGAYGRAQDGKEETATVRGLERQRIGDAGEDCQARVVFSWPDSCRQSGDQMEQ